uniref:DNA-directed RNA polymerase III subunit RPC9 n=1 Tax=Chlorocebus sabaeus TaxID=60711 RepID=A0A0D9S0B3_CHLSB
SRPGQRILEHSPTRPAENGELAAPGCESAKPPACCAARLACTLECGAGTLAPWTAAGTAVECEVPCLLAARGDESGCHGSVFQLLTDLKEQRKESGKNKHSSGQQNLNTITYEMLKYISKSPCRHQSPETVREFLTAMKSHKLTNRHTGGTISELNALLPLLLQENSEDKTNSMCVCANLPCVSSVFMYNTF